MKKKPSTSCLAFSSRIEFSRGSLGFDPMVEEVNGAKFSAKNSQQASSVTSRPSDETMILENCDNYGILNNSTYMQTNNNIR
jgi:hypothetical protein